MNRAIKLAIFAVVAAAQLGAPAWMIGEREWVLRHGTLYKFRTAPIDPYDAFRGRYVWLGFEERTAPWVNSANPSDEKPYLDKPVFALLSTGDDGFAKITKAQAAPPSTGDYLKVEGHYMYEDKPRQPTTTRRVGLVLPFDRYYMNEAKAPEAEDAVRRHSLPKVRDAFVTVRVWKGHAILEGLYIGDERIEDFIEHR